MDGPGMVRKDGVAVASAASSPLSRSCLGSLLSWLATRHRPPAGTRRALRDAKGEAETECPELGREGAVKREIEGVDMTKKKEKEKQSQQ